MSINGDNTELLTFLQQGMLSDVGTERHLTQLRSDLLKQIIAGETVSIEVLALLAQFCFDCEYVFAESTLDMERLSILNPNRSEQERWILACFRPTEFTEDLPIEEIELLHPLRDEISLAVKQQYEQHPYPRWQFLPEGTSSDERKSVLVAGCGTGRQALAVAKQLPRSEIVGLDLSRKSLAYGLARARDFGIDNVRFVQGDILDLARLGAKFDQILCTGVLHHMAHPLQGLKALKGVLNESGVIELAVYSALNRKAALAAIELRKEMRIPPTDDAIRQFRQHLLALPAKHPAKGAVTSADFYSISGARDLLFHVNEHNFTIHGVAQLIQNAGLRLIRFGVGAKPESRFRSMGFTDFDDLGAWEEVERKYPGTFSDMYRAIVGF